jgi:hypothetical protein
VWTASVGTVFTCLLRGAMPRGVDRGVTCALGVEYRTSDFSTTRGMNS